MVALEALHIAGKILKEGLFLGRIQRDLELPKLKTLIFGNLVLQGRLDDTESTPTSTQDEVTKDTSSLTSLSLIAPQYEIESVEELIAWPQALECFTIDDSPSVTFGRKLWYIPRLSSALRRHCASLKSLNIGFSNAYPESWIIDLSNFSELETLQL